MPGLHVLRHTTADDLSLQYTTATEAAEAVSAQSSNDSNVVSLVYSLVYDIDRQRRNTSAQSTFTSSSPVCFS